MMMFLARGFAVFSLLGSIGYLVLRFQGTVLPWLPFAAAALAVAALVATLVQAASALKLGSLKDWSLQLVSVVLSLILALPSLNLFSGASAPPSATAPAASAGSTAAGEPTPPAPLAEPVPASTAAAADLAALPPEPEPSDPVQAAVDAKSRLSPERWQWSSKLASLPAGHEAAFVFVRDHVGIDAYSGVLRGAVGAFLARRGNAWDRALLLQALLQDKKIEARLARGHLAPDAVEKAYARLFEPTRPVPAEATPRTAKPDPATDRIRARASRDFAAVMAAAGPSIPIAAGGQAKARAELADHVWVQANVGGTWIDLDPLLSDAAPGQALTTATATMNAPPDDVRQRVTFRVVAETITAGVVSQREALKHSATAESLLSRHIFLTHVAGAGAGGGISSMVGQVSGERWTPVMYVDGEVVRGQPIAYGAGTDAGAFFGGNEVAIVSEWLEISIAVPGTPADVSRRMLVSRGGEEARKAGKLEADALTPLARNERGAIAAQAVHAIWITAGRHNLVGYTDALADLARALQPGPDGKPVLPPTTEDALWALGVATFPFLVWSDHLVMPSADAQPDVRVYADSPRVILITKRADSRDESRAATDYDLLRDRVRSVAREAAGDRAASDRRVWFGMLEGALEHELAAGAVAAAAGNADDLLSTSGLLGPRGVVSLTAATGAQAPALAGDGNRAVRLGAAIERSAVVIVPRPDEGQAARGWWEIGADATTRAVIDEGLGGSSYSLGSGGPGGWYRPGSVPGGGWEVDPRTARDVARQRMDGSWRRFGPQAQRGGGNEYTLLTTLVAITAIVAWTFVATEVIYYLGVAGRAVDSLPVESTP